MKLSIVGRSGDGPKLNHNAYDILREGHGCVAVVDMSANHTEWIVARPNGTRIMTVSLGDARAVEHMLEAVAEHYGRPERAAADAGYYAALTE